MPERTGWFRGEGGVIYRMDLPLPEGIAQRVTAGAITRVAGPDGGPYDEPDEPGPEVPTIPTTRPAVNASKAEWIGWAVANGADYEDASGMTKADLIDRYGREG